VLNLVITEPDTGGPDTGDSSDTGSAETGETDDTGSPDTGGTAPVIVDDTGAPTEDPVEVEPPPPPGILGVWIRTLGAFFGL
jgi:hypothetical protein